jgi:hypothetical protein
MSETQEVQDAIVYQALKELQKEFLELERARYVEVAGENLTKWLAELKGKQPNGSDKRADGTWKDGPPVLLTRDGQSLKHQTFGQWTAFNQSTWEIDEKRCKEDSEKSVNAAISHLKRRFGKQITLLARLNDYQFDEIKFSFDANGDIQGLLKVNVFDKGRFDWHIIVNRKWRASRPDYQFVFFYRNIKTDKGDYDSLSLSELAKVLK